VQRLQALAASFAPADKAARFHDTAARVYRLDEGGGAASA